MNTVRVTLEKHLDESYDIFVGYQNFKELILSKLEQIKPTQVVIISDSKVYGIYGDYISEILDSQEIDYFQIHFPEGEKSKNIDTIMHLFDWMAKQNMDRKSFVVAFGGGVTGDMAGFLAAIYMRGIPFIQVPTSLLAMVDSSVGGKTGIDTPHGKNLIGSFYQPLEVIIDISFLETLPEKQFINGMSEIVKHAIIFDPEYFQFLDENKQNILSMNKEILLKMIKRSCEIKGEVVEKDEKEKGMRQILNFGHTIGHAIENATNYSLPHGYAVAMGMIAEAKISVDRGILSENELQNIIHLLQNLKLLQYLSDLSHLDIDKVISSIKLDKKNQSGKINFVILQNIGSVKEVDERFSFPMHFDEMKVGIEYCINLST